MDIIIYFLLSVLTNTISHCLCKYIDFKIDYPFK